MNKFSLLIFFQAFILQSLQFVSANELAIMIKQNKKQEKMLIDQNHPLAQEVLSITKKTYPFIPNNIKRLRVDINTITYGPAEYEQNGSVIKIFINPNNGNSWFPMFFCGVNSVSKALSKLEFLKKVEEKETSVDSLTEELIESLSNKNREESIGLNEPEIETMKEIFAIFNRQISVFMDELQKSFKMYKTEGQLFVDFFEKDQLDDDHKNQLINLFCALNGSSSTGYLPYLALPELIKWYDNDNKKTDYLLIKKNLYKQPFMIQNWSSPWSDIEYRKSNYNRNEFAEYCIEYLITEYKKTKNILLKEFVYEFIIKNKVKYKE